MHGTPVQAGRSQLELLVSVILIVATLLLIPVVFINFKYYRMGFKTLFHGSPNMDSLIAIGSSAAIVYGIYAVYKIGIGFGHGDMATVHSFMMDLYFESAGMILTLITLGKTLEARAKGKTSDAITKLMNLAPKTATVERDGKELQVPLDDAALMAERLALLCHDNVLNEEMGRAARATIEARYADEVAGQAFVDVWERLLVKVGMR